MHRVIYTLFPILILLTSCGIVGDEPRVEIAADDIFLQTDQNSYNAQQDADAQRPTFSFTLATQFENRSDRTLYMATCNASSIHPMYEILLMNPETSSISAYGGFENCAGRHDPIIIQSGEVRFDTLQISGPGSWHHETDEPIGVLEGTYRLVYDALTCPAGDGCSIPDSLSWSNEFKIQLAQ